MTIIMSIKRWYGSRRNQIIILNVTLVGVVYFFLFREMEGKDDLNHNMIRRYIERMIEEALKEEKGSGCTIPVLDPFAKEIIQFDKDLPKVKCEGRDWVKCYRSKCRVVDSVLAEYKDVVCTYRDIVFLSDRRRMLGAPVEVRGRAEYTLQESDHVRVECSAVNIARLQSETWLGCTLGFREVKPKNPPLGPKSDLNILFFAFDTTSKNGFIRRMPISYKVLTEELEAVVLNGYNIVGDGTPAALFPILTGKTELELPDVRRKESKTAYLDTMPFMFYLMRDQGYRTAYFEDEPWGGTFQFRFNGFLKQPADHYLRQFLSEELETRKLLYKPKSEGYLYCLGDTPQYAVMINITKQFFELDSNKYCFTIISDISHDDFNRISTADESFAEFLRGLKSSGVLENTLAFIMGDHGPRYSKVRATLQGRQEERLPLMAVAAPRALALRLPGFAARLRRNARALTTPFDVHATVLHALGLDQYINPFVVNGADLPRSLSLFDKIPVNRSCSEAGIHPHWCTCLRWENVSQHDKLYTRTADALVKHINMLTEELRSKCARRTLISIEGVKRQQPNSKTLSFKHHKKFDHYLGIEANAKIAGEHYQVKIVVGPGRGLYEATMKYFKQGDTFFINTHEISRINAYGKEPDCIRTIYPSLSMYCYCNN